MRRLAVVAAFVALAASCPARAAEPVALDASDVDACGQFNSLSLAMRRGEPIDAGLRAWSAWRCEQWQMTWGATTSDATVTVTHGDTSVAVYAHPPAAKSIKSNATTTPVAPATPTLDNSRWRPPYNAPVRYVATVPCSPCAMWGDTADAPEWKRRVPDQTKRRAMFARCVAQRGWCDVYVRVSDGGAFPWVPETEGPR